MSLSNTIIFGEIKKKLQLSFTDQGGESCVKLCVLLLCKSWQRAKLPFVLKLHDATPLGSFKCRIPLLNYIYQTERNFHLDLAYLLTSHAAYYLFIFVLKSFFLNLTFLLKFFFQLALLQSFLWPGYTYLEISLVAGRLTCSCYPQPNLFKGLCPQPHYF